jgi:hypothetical protein
VGGLAVLVIGVIAIILLLRRRNQQPAPAQPAVVATEVVQQQHPQQQQQPPPVAPYDPKHASYPSSHPTSPNLPPYMYQNTTDQNQASYTPPGVLPAQELANTADSYARNLAPLPVGTGMPAASYQPQYENTQPSTLAGPIEMSAETTPMPGAVEINADQA